MADPVLRSSQLDNRIRNYAIDLATQCDGYWQEGIAGAIGNRKDQLAEFRKRYAGRRSVACLDQDVKTQPFDGASNIGVPAEQIFGEFLIPLFLANTHDLNPMLQAFRGIGGTVEEPQTNFHDNYHRTQVVQKRQLLEESAREVLTVGGCFHKWTYQTLWKQQDITLPVWMHPLSGQPMMSQGATGPEPAIADPKTPKELYPVDPATGIPLKLGKVSAADTQFVREGPQLILRPYEAIGFPASATSVDPNNWDYLVDEFSVSPWWFLGREGDAFEGGLENLQALWKWLRIDPHTVYNKPSDTLSQKVRLKELHMKFPAAKSGKPVELLCLLAWEPKLLLGWRLSPMPRRNYFHRQVRSRASGVLGVGIPETMYSLRNALDASVNQDVDGGNLYNRPPLLLSAQSIMDDEDYDATGPGTQWVVGGDVRQAAAFLPPPVVQRDPVTRENWLLGMGQRIWGVTDLNLNAPTSSLSPNIQTATGVVSVLNQGNIKFGHLTKRLTETDTMEYQFVHDLFGKMLANTITVMVKGQPQPIASEQRSQFFSDQCKVVARGDGITTNPMLRSQVLTQLYQLTGQDPFIGGDLKTHRALLEQMVESMGVKLDLPTPELLQLLNTITQLMQTPAGPQLIVPAVQQAAQLAMIMQQQQQAMKQNGAGQPGGPNGAPQSVSTPRPALA